MRRYKWMLVVILPVLLGLAASIVFMLIRQPEMVMVFKMGLGIALFLAGLLLTLLVAAIALGHLQSQRNARRTVTAAQREQEAAHRRFIRNLDHEIKNPLTVLQAALASMREAGDQAEHRRAGNNAHAAVDQLRRLLADFRKLSELDDRPLEQLPVDVPALLEEMVEAACSLPVYAHREVNLLISKVPWPLPAVTGDRDLLGLAYYNLIENALKFSPESDEVEIRARDDGPWLVVEVADSGPGIPAGELNQVFEELYRGSNVHGVTGSGLGLALARRIVQLHGGTISVRSRQNGVDGTVFTVQLPVIKL
jgi:two-component system, OmpR family, sensor kinase